MQHFPEIRHPDLLVGVEHFSDAGVYRLAPDLAMVQTVDFFAPVVDDPYTFGQIAAANSLSDVYAVGGAPKTALNVVGFPLKDLGLEMLQEILRGGAERVQAAGAVIVGGHSVRDTEVKYGLAVTGTVDPARMLTNAAARVGDVLLLTKGLGTGFVIAANRGKTCPVETLDMACASMVGLNAAAAEAAVEVGASAATDVTGFGLAGHALEMALAADVALELDLHALPLLPGVEALAVEKNFTGAVKSNREHVTPSLRYEGDAETSNRAPFLFDPQTSGGLLVSMPEANVDRYVSVCIDRGDVEAAVIGRVAPAQGGTRLIIRS